jgi:hypothetical protein
MFAAAAAQVGHPAVAALLGLGTAGVAGVVVAMAWGVHVRQIRLAEQLTHRQLIVTGEADPPAGAAERVNGPPAAAEDTGRVRGNGPPVAAEGTERVRGNGPPAAAEGTERVNGTAAPVIIDGPGTVIAGEQARYRVRPSGNRKVVAWAVGGGSVSQAPDPSQPDELLLIAAKPGDLTIIVRVRDGMTERRGTKSVTAVPDMTPAPPFTLRLFLQGWGLVVVAVLIAGFAAALNALGNLSSADFIALVAPLGAVLGVVAVARGMGDPASRPANSTPTPTAHAPRSADPPAPSRPRAAETSSHNHNQSVH